MSATCRCRGRRPAAQGGAARSTSASPSRRRSSFTWTPASRSRRWRGALRVLRAVRARARPNHQRPEGQECRHPDPELERAPVLAIMAAHVGLDPHEDIDWVTSPTGNAMELFAAGKVDAFLGFPPEPQELRARKIGRVILSTATDQPWSQYFCCMVFGNREFVRAHPVATKRYPAGHPQGRRHLRRRAGAGCATAGRCRVHRALRLCAPDADRDPLRPLARVRPRGRDCGSTRSACTRRA